MLGWNKKASDESAADAASSPRPPGGPHARPPSLARLLLETGKVPEAGLRLALQKQKETGEFLGEILAREGLLDEKSLTSFLAKHCKIPHLSLLDYLVGPELLDLVPEHVCQRYRVLPIDLLGQNLTVAMVNPLNTEALDQIRALNPGLRIKPILCTYPHFETVMQRLAQAGRDPGGPAELTASSLGLRAPRAPAPSPPPPAAGPEPAPVPAGDADDDIPDALACEEAEADAAIASVFAAETGENPAPGPDPDASLHGVASAMLNSMRDTYEMLARRIELFQGLRPEDVARIFSRGITREVEPGDTVFSQGDPGDALFVILGGQIEIVEGERRIAVLGRGEMFGEMGMVSQAPRSATARALEAASLLAVNGDIVRKDMQPAVAIQILLNIAATLSARLRAANLRQGQQ